MNQLHADFSSIEASKKIVNSFLNCMKRAKDLRAEVLRKYHLLDDKEWFPFQDWMDAFKEISLRFGDMNLFLTGIAFINQDELPSINSLREAFERINLGYHSEHRKDGKLMYDMETNKLLDGIGSFSILSFDEDQKEAKIVCNTPYPSKFEEGVLYELTRKFKPNAQTVHLIKVDPTRERRTKGGQSCTYIINW